MSYKRIYIGVATTLMTLFGALLLIGFQITSNGDIQCAGTIDNPCISYLKVYNPTPTSVYIYNYDEIKLKFTPEIRDYKLYVKYYGKWVYTNFTMATRLNNIPKDRKYVFVFPAYSTKEFKLVGYKNNPNDDVKWSFETEKDVLDPYWYSVNGTSVKDNISYAVYLDNVESDRKYEVGTTALINFTINNSAYEVCMKINGINHTCFNGNKLVNWSIEPVINKFNNASTLVNISITFTNVTVLSQINSNKDKKVGQDTERRASSTFTTTTNVTLGSIILKLRKHGDPTPGNLMCQIYKSNSTSHLPLGNPLINSSDIITPSELTTSYQEKQFGFNNYLLNASTEYCIVLRQDVGWSGSNYWETAYNDTVTGQVVGNMDSSDFWVYEDSTFNGSTAQFYYYIKSPVQLINYEFNVTLDNRSDISSSYITINGLEYDGAYPTDVKLSYLNNNALNESYLEFPGRLSGSILEEDIFKYNQIEYSIFNLSYDESGGKFIYLNVSTTFNSNINITFNISGFEVDLGNNLDFHEYFNNTNPLATSEANDMINGSFSGTYENFESVYTDQTGRWSFENNQYWNTIGSGYYGDGFTYGITDDAYDMSTYRSYLATCSGVCNAYGLLTDTELDIRNVSEINVEWATYCYSLANYYQTGSAYSKIQLTDGINYVTLTQNDCTGTEEYGDGRIVYFSRPDTSSNTWLFQNHPGGYTYSTTIYTTSLNPNLKWSLAFRGECNCLVNIPSTGAGLCCAVNNSIKKIDIGGVLINKSSNSADYSPSYSLRSEVIDSTSNNITAATLYAEDYTPQNTSITYYLSNDNGATWDSVIEGQRHVFSTEGSSIRWNATLLTQNLNVTPIVNSINVRVIASTLENVTVDLGNDGINDYNYTSKLNQTNSPQTAVFSNAEPIGNYIGTYCGGMVTCLVPIKIGIRNGGVIEVKDMSFRQNINPVRLSNYFFEYNDINRFEINIVNGIIQLSNLNVTFLGEQNIPLFFYLVNDSSQNFTRYINARYSKFNLTLPNGIYWWDVFPSSLNESGVIPYGQNNNTPIWNVTNLATSDNFELYVRSNESFNNCLNISMKNSHINSNVTDLNMTPKLIIGNLSIGNYTGIWNWIGLKGCSNPIYFPYFHFSTICTDCVKTWDFDLSTFMEE